MNIKSYHIFLSTLLGALLLSLGCAPKNPNTGDEGEKSNAVNVNAARVKATSAPIEISTSGILMSKAQIKLSFKVPGVIQTIAVDEGDRVSQGQVLAQLDLSEINAHVKQAESAFEMRKRDLERGEKLLADTVATLEQVQNLRTAYEVAESTLEIALFNQKHSTIYAPESGKILKRLSEESELIGAGMPVFVLGSSQSAMVVKAGLADADIVRVKIGDKANVEFDAYPGETFDAYVSEIAESADPVTGTFEVELTLRRTSHALKDGFVGKAEILPNRHQNYYNIPMDAIVDAEKRTAFVYVPNKDQKTVSKVKLNVFHIGNDSISATLADTNAIDIVITDGAKFLNDNSEIAVKNWP